MNPVTIHTSFSQGDPSIAERCRDIVVAELKPVGVVPGVAVNLSQHPDWLDSAGSTGPVRVEMLDTIPHTIADWLKTKAIAKRRRTHLEIASPPPKPLVTVDIEAFYGPAHDSAPGAVSKAPVPQHFLTHMRPEGEASNEDRYRIGLHTATYLELCRRISAVIRAARFDCAFYGYTPHVEHGDFNLHYCDMQDVYYAPLRTDRPNHVAESGEALFNLHPRAPKKKMILQLCPIIELPGGAWIHQSPENIRAAVALARKHAAGICLWLPTGDGKRPDDPAIVKRCANALAYYLATP